MGVEPSGVRLEQARDCVVTGNSVRNIRNQGIYVRVVERAVVSANNVNTTEVGRGIDVLNARDILIADNIVRAANQEGISLSKNNTLPVFMVENITIRGNQILSSLRQGILVIGADLVAIANNLIDKSMLSAIDVRTTETVTITDNTVTDTGTTGTLNIRGISLNAVADTTIQGNSVYNSAQEGIIIEAPTRSGISVVGNKIRDTGNQGIRILNSTGVPALVTSNVVSGWVGAGITAQGDANEMSGNLILP